ncbi:alpha-ketoglutarate dehydrogenase component 4 [Anopheles ziemanni]|uniref:alpha-ketoglutarate dehydrogenase component 4 n=1 Tax=Anopheles coustani TaxID=139045 RepID=UPI0026596EC7|nr:alpha-ketoglutarate dehydrogenase component 4 [Anopheles coustani]XP_058175029.1 alpha-ketoglutarate dehydrogenase component 4 [Anopheles ziemanni]
MVMLRSVLSSARRIPLIKFRKGGPFLDTVGQTAGGATGSAAAAAPAHARSVSSGEAIEEWQLPARYRRKPIDDVEMEWINRGGPPA